MTLSRHQPTIMVTRRNEVGATWLGVDSRRPLSGRDQAMVTRLVEALMEADRFALELPAVLHLMRDHQAGQPRAQSLTPSTGGGAYVDDDLERPTGHHDPTGDAAVRPDHAASDQREIRRHVEAAINAIDRAIAISSGYPAHAAELEDVEPTPGEDWCSSCWKDGRYLSPIAVKADGSRRYSGGLCSWCGPFVATNGFEPPTAMLHARHRGERITETMVAAARADWKRLHPDAKRKGKGRRK